MSLFPVDRSHPPSRIIYSDDACHIELRPWSFSDVDALVSALDASRRELCAFMPWAHLPMGRENEYAAVRCFQSDYWAGREFVLGMFSKRGEVLGGVGLHNRCPLNERCLEVAFWCSTPFAGKGWTTLAVKVLTSVVFDWFGCDRLQVSHDEANVPSRRVAEKCNFAYEGTLRRMTAEVDASVRRGGYRGSGRHLVYSITTEDLPRLEWLSGIRLRTIVVDALGGERHFGDRNQPTGQSTLAFAQYLES